MSHPGVYPNPFLYQETFDGWWVQKCTGRFIKDGPRRYFEYVTYGFIPRLFTDYPQANHSSGQSSNQSSKRASFSNLSSKKISQQLPSPMDGYNLKTGQRKLVIIKE